MKKQDLLKSRKKHGKNPNLIFINDLLICMFTYLLLMVVFFVTEKITKFIGNDHQIREMHIFKDNVEIYTFYLLLAFNSLRFVILSIATLLHDLRKLRF